MIRWNISWKVLIVALLLAITIQPLKAEPRHALLIGNQDYAREVGKLSNPVNDVRLIEQALLEIGFAKGNIRTLTNADRVTTLAEVTAFAQRLSQAGADALGFFYYSGHGAANNLDRRNYIIPVGAGALDDRVWFKSVALDDITATLSGIAPNAAHFVIFDACRNVLKLPSRGMKGFVPIAERRGMLIAFSTDPGQTASDAGAKSGPYAAALASEIRTPGLDHLDVFQNVKERVYRDTRIQVPWTRDGLLNRVRFTSARKVAAPAQKPVQPKPSVAPANPIASIAKAPISTAAEAWQYAKDSKNCAMLAGFSTRFSGSIWADFAIARMRSLACPARTSSIETAATSPPLTTGPALPPEGTLALTPAERRRVIRGVQKQLQRLNCYTGAIDGQWGPASRKALKAALAGGESASADMAKIMPRQADNLLVALRKPTAKRCKPVIRETSAPAKSRPKTVSKNAPARAATRQKKKKTCRHVMNEDRFTDKKAPFMIEVCN